MPKKTVLLSEKIPCLSARCRGREVEAREGLCPRCKQPIVHLDMLPRNMTLEERYLLDCPLARDEMRILYRAWDMRLERRVLVEEFMPRGLVVRTGGSLTMTDASRKAFETQRTAYERETLALAKIQHPGVLPVLDRFHMEQIPVRVMGYMEGRTLEKLFSTTPADKRASEWVERLIQQIVDALAECHRGGMVHLNLCPASVVMAKGGRAILTDFATSRVGVVTDKGTRLLDGGPYTAPEVASGRNPGPAADVFSLSALAHEALLGAPPRPMLHRLLNRGSGDELDRLDPKWRTAIEAGLSHKIEARPKSVRAWWEMILNPPARAADPGIKPDKGKLARSAEAPSEVVSAELEAQRKELKALKDKIDSLSMPAKKSAKAPDRDKDFGLVGLETFKMGSYSGLLGEELGRDSDETQHKVTFEHKLWVMKTPVTQGHWLAVMGNCPARHLKGEHPRLDWPMEMVTWWDAIAFCNTLSESHGFKPAYKIDGRSGTPGVDLIMETVKTPRSDAVGYRLATEAEWECLCRAGTKEATWRGDLKTPMGLDPALVPIAVYADTAKDGPGPVGGREQNPVGLSDMLGGVMEWVWDWYAPFTRKADSNPRGPSTGTEKVLRGGSWRSQARWVRAAARQKARPETRGDAMGFRVVRSCRR